MTLSASSALFYWSSRFGSVPVVGGDPTHSRTSAACWLDQQNRLRSAIVNTPREQWASVSGERRKVLTLEQARSNLITAGIDTWGGGAVITTGQTDPFSGTAARLVADTGADADRHFQVTFGSDGQKSVSVCLKQGTSTDNQFGIYNATGSFWYGLFHVSWSGGVPTCSLNTGSGTVLTTTNLGSGWWLIRLVIPSVVHTNSTYFYFYPDTSATSKTVYLYAPMVEDYDYPSSVMDTNVSRAADNFETNITFVPQALMMYLRFIERGTVLQIKGVVQIGGDVGSTLAFGVYSNGQGGGFSTRGYYVYEHNGTTSVSKILGGGFLPNFGDTVELVAMMYDTAGASYVELLGRINGGAVTDTGGSSSIAPPSSWYNQFLWMNSAGPSLYGITDFADLKVVKYGDVASSAATDIMNELANFELGANGGQL